MNLRTFHKQLEKRYGKATMFDCEDCDKQAADWSWNRVGDRFDDDNYSPRCHSCNIKGDYTNEWKKKVGDAFRGKTKLSDEAVAFIQKNSRTYTRKALAEKFGVSIPCILRILERCPPDELPSSGTF
jgi:hypothetical protein